MKHEKGNLLDLAENGKFDLIVHGANCFNTMGGGIAKEIRQRYPEVAAIDAETERGDYNKLGTYTVGYAWFNEHKGDNADNFTIINAYTQYNMSRDEDVFEYDAFKLILQKLAHSYPKGNFGFPKIGCGLACGDELRIMGMIEDFSRVIGKTGGTVTVVEFQ